MLDEAQRQQAMQAFGLPVLVSRFILPGAKESSLLESCPNDYVADSAAQQQASEPSNAVSKPQSGQQGLEPLLEQTTQDAIKNVSGLFEQGPSPLELNSIEVSDELRYIHCIYQLGQTLYIIDPLDDEVSCLDLSSPDTEGSSRVQRFLSDVEQFIFGQRLTFTAHQPFEWPHPKLQKNIRSNEMAYPMEQAYLSELYNHSTFERVIVFSGGQLNGLLQESLSIVPPERESVLTTSILEKPAYIAPSLQFYWENPSQKMKLWQTLKSLTGS